MLNICDMQCHNCSVLQHKRGCLSVFFLVYLMTNRLLNSRNQGVKLWLVSMALLAPAGRGRDYTICFQKVTDGHCEVAMYSEGRQFQIAYF